MTISLPALSAILTAAAIAASIASPANALSLKDCSAKYAAAKTDGSLGGKSWNDFQRLECAADAAPLSAATGTAAAPTPSKSKKVANTSQAPAAPAQAATPPTPVKSAAKATISAVPVPAGVVFPSAIKSAYAQESAGKARMHTCLDQYKANKSSNANGGLEWIQKGGGYYSACNTRLKS